jgi:hypothetical protein
VEDGQDVDEVLQGRLRIDRGEMIEVRCSGSAGHQQRPTIRRDAEERRDPYVATLEGAIDDRFALQRQRCSGERAVTGLDAQHEGQRLGITVTTLTAALDIHEPCEPRATAERAPCRHDSAGDRPLDPLEQGGR